MKRRVEGTGNSAAVTPGKHLLTAISVAGRPLKKAMHLVSYTKYPEVLTYSTG